MRKRQAIWIFKSGRKERLESACDFPTEFFYGFPELKENGWSIGLLEDIDLKMAFPLKPTAYLLNKLARFFGRIPIGLIVGLIKKQVRRKLPVDTTIIATTNNIGLALGLAKTLGIIRSPVVLMAMGLVPIRPSWWQKKCFEKILQNIKTVTISRAEQQHLSNVFPGITFEYLTFGVDIKFWKKPSATYREKKYILALGNDANRDWKTLISAWDKDLPPLKIVTRLPVPKLPCNVEVIYGDWRERALTDARIRELYWGAQMVVIPLTETIQPAGQSVCLQAMACGCPVIMSDIAGLWNKDELKNGRHWCLVEPENTRELRNAVIKLSSNQKIRNSIATEASKAIENHYNTQKMAASWELLLNMK